MMRAAALILVICTLLQIVAGIRKRQHTCQPHESTPKISYISQKQVRDIGETVELECVVQFEEDYYPILWMMMNHSSGPIDLSINRQMILKDSRFSVIKHGPLNTVILQIKDLQETDAGIYQCKIQTTVNEHVSAFVELLVNNPSINEIINDKNTYTKKKIFW